MSSLLYNFFPTDLPPQQFPVNGERNQKKATQITITSEGTMNCNFFPTDLLAPFHLPAGGDTKTTQTVHQADPAQERTNKVKGVTLRIQKVHSHSSSPVVLGLKTIGSRQTTAFPCFERHSSNVLDQVVVQLS